MAPGENPSLRFHSVGSTGAPATLRGVASGEMSTRRPVGVVASRAVNWSLGNGSRHNRVSRSSHAPIAVAAASSAASSGACASSSGAVGAAPRLAVASTARAHVVAMVDRALHANSLATGDPSIPMGIRGGYSTVARAVPP